MAIELTDDGTMDTVLRCSECGEEFRYTRDTTFEDDSTFPTREDKIGALMDANPGMSAAGASDFLDRVLYDEYVDECIAEVESEHECELEESEPDDDEPDEDAITTSDHERFYQYGKLVLERLRSRNNPDPFEDWYAYNRRGVAEKIGRFGDDYRAALRAYMDREQFWPSVFFISDHGNAHLIDLSKGGK